MNINYHEKFCPFGCGDIDDDRADCDVDGCDDISTGIWAIVPTGVVCKYTIARVRVFVTGREVVSTEVALTGTWALGSTEVCALR